MVVFSVPGHVVGTYNFRAYTDQVISVYFNNPDGTPIFPVEEGQQVGVEIVAQGGNVKTQFIYHKSGHSLRRP